MPGIAWVMVVLWGGLTGSALLGPPKVWNGTDPTRGNKGLGPIKLEYRLWTSSPRRDKAGTCHYKVFAMVSGQRLRRLRVNGHEQLVDWSWSWDASIPPGRSGSIAVEFIDPVTREVHPISRSESCWKL